MNKYMIAYHGGVEPATKEEGMAQMEKWKQWVAGLGDKIVNSGTPLPETMVVTAVGTQDERDPDAMKGIAVVQASSMDEAVRIAQGDPFLMSGGTIRVHRMMEM